MRSRYRIHPDGAHFITLTIVAWLSVFTTPACCQIMVDALQFAQKSKGMQIYGWVILDNHFHAVVAGPDLAKSIGELKRFTARQLLAQIQEEDRDWLVNQLGYDCAAHKRSAGQRHQIWQEGFHPQSIYSDEVMLQKLEYIHLNPVRRGWVSAPEHWRFSSAHEWLPGVVPLLKCDEWR